MLCPGPQSSCGAGQCHQSTTLRWALPAPHTGPGVCRAPSQALAVPKWCELHRAAGRMSVPPGPQWLGKSCIPWRTLLQGAGEPWPLAGENNSCLHPADSRASPLATEQPSQEMCVRPEPAGTALGPSWLQVGQHICDTSGCPGCPQPSTVSCSKPA